VAKACDAAERATELPAVSALLDDVLLADAPAAAGAVMARLDALAAATGDLGQIMGALPPLADALRYGTVRQTDAQAVSRIVDALLARVCVGLPSFCASLDDDQAQAAQDHLLRVEAAVALLQDEAHAREWRAALAQVASQADVHGLVAGRCCRLLLDATALAPGDAARHMSLALSPAADAAHGAAWLEGFLAGSGLVLLHDEALWGVLDGWITALDGEAFTAVLPLLRRAFSAFPGPERRQLGERARHSAMGWDGEAAPGAAGAGEAFDRQRAEATLPLLATLLGLDRP
jgi:hypothetical protein